MLGQPACMLGKPDGMLSIQIAWLPAKMAVSPAARSHPEQPDCMPGNQWACQLGSWGASVALEVEPSRGQAAKWLVGKAFVGLGVDPR